VSNHRLIIIRFKRFISWFTIKLVINFFLSIFNDLYICLTIRCGDRWVKSFRCGIKQGLIASPSTQTNPGYLSSCTRPWVDRETLRPMVGIWSGPNSSYSSSSAYLVVPSVGLGQGQGGGRHSGPLQTICARTRLWTWTLWPVSCRLPWWPLPPSRFPNHCSFSVLPARRSWEIEAKPRTSESTTLHKATRGLRRPPAATTQKLQRYQVPTSWTVTTERQVEPTSSSSIPPV